VAALLGRARLGEKGHQRRDDQDRLEPFAHQQEERRHEEAHRRRPIGDDPLGALESAEEALANRGQLLGIPTPDARPQGVERRLELAREPGVPRAHFRLDLLEREVRAECDLLRPGGERRVDLAAHRGECGGRRGAPVLQRGDVGGRRPPIFLGEVVGELGHRSARHSDRDLLIDLQQRRPAHHRRVGEIGRRRALQGLCLGAVAPTGLAVARSAPFTVDRSAARQRRRSRRQRLIGSDALDQRLRRPRDRVRGRQAVEEAREARETAVRGRPHGGGQRGDVEPGLLDEEFRLCHLLREAERVLLGGERRGRDHAPSGSHRINRLPGERHREAGG
jgi:hypothetical protein